jgi:hypothetical protein
LLYQNFTQVNRIYISLAFIITFISKTFDEIIIIIVNSHYHNGTICPAVTQNHALCPIVCVQDQLDCPIALGPKACANGLSLCSDGSCQSSCTSNEDSNNKCSSCPSKPGISLKSCLTTSSIYVDIPNYKPDNATMQLYESCTTKMMGNNANFMYSTWKDVKENDYKNTLIWNVCGAPSGMTFPIKGIMIVMHNYITNPL